MLSNVLQQLNLLSINTCTKSRRAKGLLGAPTGEKIRLDTSAKTYLEELAAVSSRSLQRPSSATALDKQWLEAIPF